MKKVLLIIMLVSNNMLTFLANAQDIYLDIENRPNDTSLCCLNNQRVFINAQVCDAYAWMVNGQVIENTSPIIINPTSYNYNYHILYAGCENFWHEFNITYKDAPVPSPFTQIVWKRFSTIETLDAEPTIWNYDNYSFQWSTGETGRTIDVSEPGAYSCEISSVCGSVIRTFIVRDNVELYRASVDLATNLNKTTWQVTEEQAEYVNEVKVYRDGLLVGTAPYEQGYFLDAIGSDNAARNYHLVAVTIEGEESPVSFQKGTIHTTYYEDVNGNLNMTWNIPYVEEGAQGTLTYFQVCKYDPATGDLTVVDQVNSLITDYTCGVNQFEGGYPVIAAVFSDAKNRDFEDRSFSNMYTDISVQPLEITITLSPGWTWFSYPYAMTMNYVTALGDFVPMEGDIIKSQSATSYYRNGQWKGGSQQFVPGKGYKYFSARTEPATLVFDLSSSRTVVKP